MSKLLINESPLQVQPSLAKAIGLHEAIFLQQVHYWLGGSKFMRDGRKWVYNTYEQWLRQLKYLSLPTLKRAIKSLKTQKLLYVERLDRMRSNQVNYYSINYDVLNSIEESIKQGSNEIEDTDGSSNHTNRMAQIELKESVKMNLCRSDQNEPIYTREYQETTQKNKKSECIKLILNNIRNIELPNSIDRELWFQFVEMRISIKKPLTLNAAVLLIKKLTSFGESANQSLENSIIASYQSVYPPKQEKKMPHSSEMIVKRFGQNHMSSDQKMIEVQ